MLLSLLTQASISPDYDYYEDVKIISYGLTNSLFWTDDNIKSPITIGKVPFVALEVSPRLYSFLVTKIYRNGRLLRTIRSNDYNLCLNNADGIFIWLHKLGMTYSLFPVVTYFNCEAEQARIIWK
jgi:hypothetical protein